MKITIEAEMNPKPSLPSFAIEGTLLLDWHEDEWVGLNNDERLRPIRVCEPPPPPPPNKIRIEAELEPRSGPRSFNLRGELSLVLEDNRGWMRLKKE
jgi:hypothetical protein